MLDYCDNFDGETNIFNGATGDAAGGKVLVGSAEGVTWELPTAMELTDKETLTVSYVDYNGWQSGGHKKVVQFLGDESAVLAEYQYNDLADPAGASGRDRPCAIDSLKVNSVAQIEQSTRFDAQSKNGGSGANKLENFAADDNQNCIAEFSVSGKSTDNVQLKYTVRGTEATTNGSPWKATVDGAKFKGVKLLNPGTNCAAIGKFRVTLTREAGE